MLLVAFCESIAKRKKKKEKGVQNIDGKIDRRQPSFWLTRLPKKNVILENFGVALVVKHIRCHWSHQDILSSKTI